MLNTCVFIKSYILVIMALNVHVSLSLAIVYNLSHVEFVFV